MTIAALLAKYDHRIPRYTSYPTALHFSPAVTGAGYGGRLRALPDDSTLSLYLHVPFCESLCLFCACHTTIVHRPEPKLAYADDLLKEIGLIRAAVGRALPVCQIHWGGGTPTCLPPGCMIAVMDLLRASFAFEPDAEIAVELDPRTLTNDVLDTLAHIGVTRASIGVQDFNPTVQRAINRHQDLDLTAHCAARLRTVGITSLNLDLIYGLPHQTAESVAETARQAMRLAPDRAAVFGYAHVPWMKKHQALLPEAALPDAEARFTQRQVIEDEIVSHGYLPVGLDHFARPDDSLARAAAMGLVRRNFQGYTTDKSSAILGIGASSIGSLPQGYVQNHAAIPAWRDAVRAGRLPTARGIALSPADELRRAVIERIMCSLEVDLRLEASRHGMAWESLMDAAPRLQDMARDGLVRWDGRTVTVTPAGKPFTRAVAAAFDTWLRPGETRHSAAV